MTTKTQIAAMAFAFALLITVIVLLIVQPWNHNSQSAPATAPGQHAQRKDDDAAWQAIMSKIGTSAPPTDPPPFVDGNPQDTALRTQQNLHMQALRRGPAFNATQHAGRAATNNSMAMDAALRHTGRRSPGAETLSHQQALQGMV